MSTKFPASTAIAAIRDWVKARTPDMQTDGHWQYRIFPDNTFEAHYVRIGVTFSVQNASGNFYRSDPSTFALPTALSNATPRTVQAQVMHPNFPVFGSLAYISPIKVQALSGANRGTNGSYIVIIDCWGTI